MIAWWSDPALAGEAGKALADLDAVFALDGEQVAWSPLCRVIRVSLDGKRYYVKLYSEARRRQMRNWFGLRDLVAPLRVTREWENLQAFKAWGIPTARLVAYGVQRRWGRFVRGAVVTEELCGTTDLGEMARSRDPRLADRAWVAGVSRQLAQATRTMHAAGFAHNDLKWRNLLADRSDPPRLYFIDCPNGTHWWEPFLSYRKIKDLACLDKLAKYHLTRTQRLRFYLDYAGHARLDADDRKTIRKVLAFFEGRE